jgi:hypothetical protein
VEPDSCAKQPKKTIHSDLMFSFLEGIFSLQFVTCISIKFLFLFLFIFLQFESL